MSIAASVFQRREFQFTAMQTTSGRELLMHHGIDPNDPATFLLVDAGTAYTDTALRIFDRFGLAWRVFDLDCAWCARVSRAVGGILFDGV